MPDRSLPKNSVLPTLLLLMIAAIWGSGFIASQVALDAHVSPEFFMAVRFSIAAVVMLCVFWRQLRERFSRSDLKKGCLLGLFLFLGFYVQIIGLQYTTPSSNAFLTSTNVVMVPFLWWAISRTRPDARIFLSSALCLVGIGVLSLRFSGGLSFSLGDLLTLACAFFFACHIALTGKLAAEVDTAVLVFLQFATAAVLSLLVFLVTDRDVTGWNSLSGMGSMLYLALFSTCLCYFLQTSMQRHVSSSRAAIILSTEALFGTLFSVVLGYEALTVNMAAGGGIILLSLLLTQWNPQKKAG